MTEIPVPAVPSKRPKSRGLVWGVCSAGVIVLAVVAAGELLTPPPQPKIEKPVSDMAAKYAALEDHMHELDKRIDDMTIRMANLTAVAPVAEAFNTSANNAPVANNEVQALKQNLAALSSTVKAMENDVKASSVRADASVAASVAYIQLRDAVLSNKSFSVELAAFKKAAPARDQIAKAANDLENSAASGIASLTSLKDEFIELENSAHHAVEKNVTDGWTEKLKSKLDSLITIRSTHNKNSADSKLADIEKALDDGNLSQALDDVRALPADAAAVYTDWLVKFEKRINSEKDLHDISDNLMAPPEKPEVPATTAPVTP